MKKILSLLLPILALAGGIVAGEFIRPADTAEAAALAGEPSSDPEGAPAVAAPLQAAATGDGHGVAAASPGEAWFTFPSQFFVPMMRNGDMGAIMILTLSIETATDTLEPMKQQEHRLRDALLRQLLIHANTGGFDGNFTSDGSMRALRDGLSAAARQATTLPVRQVLIEDIAR